MAILLFVLSAGCSSGEQSCKSCPDALFTEDACRTLAVEYECEEIDFATLKDDSCRNDEEMIEYTTCTLSKCKGGEPSCDEL